MNAAVLPLAWTNRPPLDERLARMSAADALLARLDSTNDPDACRTALQVLLATAAVSPRNTGDAVFTAAARAVEAVERAFPPIGRAN